MDLPPKIKEESNRLRAARLSQRWTTAAEARRQCERVERRAAALESSTKIRTRENLPGKPAPL